MSITPSIPERLLYSDAEFRLIERYKKVLTEEKGFEWMEGNENHFYGCSKGKVTIGVGHLVNDNASLKHLLALKAEGKLNFMLKSNNGGVRTATDQEVMAAHAGVKKQIQTGARPEARAYKAANNGVYLDKESIKFLLDGDIKQKLRDIKNKFDRILLRETSPPFKRFMEYPFDVQLALLDMTFQTGAVGLIGDDWLGITRKEGEKNYFGFPNMLNAIRQHRWSEAARESQMSLEIVSAFRNQFRYDCFMAARVEEEVNNFFDGPGKYESWKFDSTFPKSFI